MEREKLFELIKKLIKKYNESGKNIQFEKEFIEEILFIDNNDGTRSINDDIFYELRANHCDMNEVSFKNVHIKNHYFNGLKNVEINIQEIPNYDISNTNLEGVKITGTLDGAYIRATKFKGYIGDLVLNPQLVQNKDLHYVDLDGITINGSFDDTDISMIKFEGSKGNIIINPQKVKDKNISYINFYGVELVGEPIEDAINICYNDPCFDGCDIYETSFPGCKGNININPQLVKDKRMVFSDLSNVNIIGSLEGVNTCGTKLKEEKIDAETLLMELNERIKNMPKPKRKILFFKK